MVPRPSVMSEESESIASREMNDEVVWVRALQKQKWGREIEGGREKSSTLRLGGSFDQGLARSLARGD